MPWPAHGDDRPTCRFGAGARRPRSRLCFGPSVTARRGFRRVTDNRFRVVLVTGLSGGGKRAVMHELEDLGYEAVDNPPLPMLEEMVSRSDQRLAIGVDARTRGFDADEVLQALKRLQVDRAIQIGRA